MAGIGYSVITNVSIRKAKSKLRGHTQALCIIAKFQNRYEFVFTSLVKNSPRLFTTVQAVQRSYETSKLYRDLKLRGSVVKDGELILLPREEIFTNIVGVWNLSSDQVQSHYFTCHFSSHHFTVHSLFNTLYSFDTYIYLQGNLGSFFLTNVRVVWHANLASNFNVSLPYMQMKNIRIRDSKFGQALVIETFARAGGYILGFRIDPPDKLNSTLKEIQNLHSVFSVSPNFGVDFTLETDAPPTETVAQPRIEEDIELIDEETDLHAMAAYYADGGEEGESTELDIRFDERLGLAIEGLQNGVTMEQLWKVM